MKSLRNVKISKSLQTLFTGVLFVASLNVYSQSERGGGNILHDALSKEEIRGYLTNNGVKLKNEFLIPLLENAKLFREDFSTEEAFEDWKFLSESKSENNTLKDDILFSPYVVSERGEEVPCEAALSAGTQIRNNTDSKAEVQFKAVCFNLDKLAKDNTTSIQLAALAIHEHSHHFGFNEERASRLQADIQAVFSDEKEKLLYERVTLYSPMIEGMPIIFVRGDAGYFNNVCRILTGNKGALSEGYKRKPTGISSMEWAKTVRETNRGQLEVEEVEVDFNSDGYISQLSCLIPRRPYKEFFEEIGYGSNSLSVRSGSRDYAIRSNSNYAQVCKELTGHPRAEWSVNSRLESHEGKGESFFINSSGSVVFMEKKRVKVLELIYCLVPKEVLAPRW